MANENRRGRSSSEWNDPSDSSNNNQMENTMKSVKLVASGIVLLIIFVLTFMAFKIVTVTGNELGVKETWSTGVEETILQPKTYWLFPGWSQTVYKYDASSQVFVMNDKPMREEKAAAGREKDSYLVQSQEGQDMRISMNLRWRIDPKKLVQIHKTVRHDIEEKIIRPVVMRVVKDEATKMKAIDAYSGAGLVQLQSNIQNSLASVAESGEGKELAQRGIIVENFVIEHIELDPNYILEIKGKQIATQKTLRAVEEQKAAEAQALVAKANAQAEYNTKLVAQQLLATNMVIQAGADNERVVIAAKAQAEQVTIAAKAQAEQVKIAADAQKAQMELEGQGKKSQMTAVADGTLAQGKAEAMAKELMLKAYMTAGTNAYVQVEVAKAMAQAYGNIKGFLPSDLKLNILTENFHSGLDAATGNLVIPVK